ncbi:alginate O-acetyltransferase AlgX-related protein [Jannaschia formosa]|uniref:alginate O-acetyltransferase AlgX-related protein n=1 Tax=Jannaschia formosa TaxID=2259592 RepID=UPI000E1C1FFF|nr:hypothetical protein [Jannaschia formosa]TFL16187.1 hypothetical protein DR046_21300 [Jannaschia formosa]
MPVIMYVRFLLPAAFLAYAGFVNVSVFTGPALEQVREVEDGLLSGAVTGEMDRLYTRAVPHRQTAFGWIGAARYALLGEGRAGVRAGRDGWLFTDEEMKIASDDQIRQAAEWAGDLRARLSRAGTELVIVPLPAKADLYRDRLDGAAALAGAAMERQHARFLSELGENGVPAVDVRPAMAAAASEAPVFLARDTHWTPAGSDAVAGAIAASGAVPTGEDEFLLRRETPTELTGDLVSFVTTDALAARVGLGPEPVAPFTAHRVEPPAGGLFASEAPRVGTLLVGTSYSADEAWSFLPALKHALRRDVLNYAASGQGPIRPMQAILDGPVFEGEGPDLVIWEFPIRYLADPDIWPAPPRASAIANQEIPDA